MYEGLHIVPLQNGIDDSAPLFSPRSESTLSAGSWNSIVSGSGYTRPYAGATSQGAGTGSYIMLPFGNTWGGIKSFAFSDKTFTAPGSVGVNQVQVTAANDYVTGMSCTVSTPGTLPTGLLALTTYYLIVVDSTHLAFATSVANALLGTRVTITTTTGSGTITIDVSNSSVVASGNWFQDIGQSRWGIGSGQPHIEGVTVPGWTLSTNLQLQIAVNGVYGAPVQAGLSQPNAPEIGIITTSGTVTNSVSAKLERSRPSTGAVSLASPSSAVIVPQANRVRVTFPLAQAGQTHWRVFFTLMGFGGTGVYYLTPYAGDITDIPETTVAASSASGSRATGTLTLGVNPSVGETISVNGLTFEFVAVPASPTEVAIGASAADTAVNFADKLALSTNPLITVADYGAGGGTVSITYSVDGTVGNSFTLADSSGGNVTRSASTLLGGVDGIPRSLEFNWQDGDLIPIEASFDDYPPPAATHAIRLNTVMNLAGCYSDSTTGPTSTNPGTCIAVSKENNYESYVPTSLLYLPEQVVDVLARPIDDYGYIGCQNSISAIQYVGPRGADLPSCTITTILPDIGVQYPQNWCTFRGQLLIYTAQGNLVLMDQSGNFDTNFAAPVSKILRGFATVDTAVSYDQTNDSIVVMNGHRMLVYSRQNPQWRQIWLPDYGITGTTVSAVAAKRNLYFTILSSGVNTAYTYDTASSVLGPVSFVSNYQSAPGGPGLVKDLYEMTIAAETGAPSSNTKFAVSISTNRANSVFRRVTVTSASSHVTNTNEVFYSGMVGKRVIVFGTNLTAPGLILFHGLVSAFNSATDVTLTDLAGVPFAPITTKTELLMFVGSYTAVVDFTTGNFPNFFPNLVENRSYQIAMWFKGLDGVGNVLDCSVSGAAYASSRALG